MPQHASEGLTRRDALRLLALGAEAGVAGYSNGSPSARSTSHPAAQSSLTSVPAPRVPDLDGLADRISGDVVRRGESGYRGATHLFKPRFDDIRPKAVAYCANAADVAAAVTFARGADLPLALRAGGYSYGGWSTGNGLVLVSRIRGLRQCAAAMASRSSHGYRLGQSAQSLKIGGGRRAWSDREGP